jgi:hypothetical protein
MAVMTASLTARARSSATSPGIAARQLLQASSDGAPQPGKAGRRCGKENSQLWPAAGVAAVMAWWGILQARVVQLRHRTKVGAVWR